MDKKIDLLAILRKNLDQGFIYFIHGVQSSCVRAFVVHIQKFHKCTKISFDSDSFLEWLKGLLTKSTKEN